MGDQAGDLAGIQGSQADVDHPVGPPQRRPEPANGVDRVRAVGDDEQAGVLAESEGQIGQQIQRRRVGPVNVVDQQGERSSRRLPMDQRVDGVEQPSAADSVAWCLQEGVAE